MSNLSRFKQFLIIVVLLSVLVAFYARGASPDDELLVDPTAPLFRVDQGTSGGEGAAGFGLLDGDLLSVFDGYELSSILIRENDRVAVVNDMRVRVGDHVDDDARVTSIDADSVTLNVDGELQTLQLYENSIKTLVKGEG